MKITIDIWMHLTLALVLIFLVACGKSGGSSAAATKSAPVSAWVQYQTVGQNLNIVIRKPTIPADGIPWVWYAPSFSGEGTTPISSQQQWYFDQLNDAGVTVIGLDVGESFGSPTGQQQYTELYDWMQANGYAQKGCFIAQSRGGLQIYEWLLAGNQSAAACVAGIYPLVTLTDYVGLVGMAPAWGLTVDQMQAELPQIDVLSRATELTIPIYHLHGNADSVVHLSNDEEFCLNAQNCMLTVVPNQGHEAYSVDFFHSQALLDFILEHVITSP